MKCKIIHESRGRLRVHLECARMSLDEADVLEYYMRSVDGVDEVKVYDRTRDAVICYCAERAAVINALAAFSFPTAEAMQLVPEHTTRELNREFEDKLAMAAPRRTASKLFLPVPVTTAIAIVRSLKYIHEGLKALLHGKTLSRGAGRDGGFRLDAPRRFLDGKLRHVHALPRRDS